MFSFDRFLLPIHIFNYSPHSVTVDTATFYNTPPEKTCAVAIYNGIGRFHTEPKSIKTDISAVPNAGNSIFYNLAKFKKLLRAYPGHIHCVIYQCLIAKLCIL